MSDDEITQSPIRHLFDWKPADAQIALQRAEQGDIRLAADLCESMMSDDRIQGVLGKVAQAIVAIKPKLTGQSVDAALADWPIFFCDSVITQLVQWGIFLGLGLAELRWSPSESGRLVPSLELWHPRDLYINLYTCRYQISTTTGLVYIEDGDKKWLLFAPWGLKRFWAFAAWRATAKWYQTKYWALTDWAKHSEMHGNGMIHGETPQSASDSDREKFAADLRARGRGSVVVTRPGWKIDLKEASGNTWELFPAQIDKANEAFSVCFLGSNLSTQVDGGSYSATQTHEGIEIRLIRGYAKSLAESITKYLLKPWAEINFDDASLAPKLELTIETKEDETENADAFSKKTQAVVSLVEKAVVSVDEGRAMLGMEPKEPAVNQPAASQPEVNQQVTQVQ